MQDLTGRGVRSPMLVRFSDILAVARARARRARSASSIAESRLPGPLPRRLPDQGEPAAPRRRGDGALRRRRLGIGLEAGSKPELLIALALLDTPGALIICNGYKDRAYVETALLAQRLGRTPIIVIDRFHELDLVIKTASELGIRPHIGLRARLTTKGAGKWMESTGDRSKFGLGAAEIVEAVERLRADNLLDCLELLHFHIGSQITAIRAHRDALREASRIFVGPPPARRDAARSSTSAAGWASTTTARRPTSTRRRTTRRRSTRTTSWRRCRRPATWPASPTRTS